MQISNKVIKFGTDGWRGIIADDFTFAKVKLVTQALANYLKKEKQNQGIFIGYDCRFLSQEFAHTIAQVLKQNKIKVIISDNYIPTPVVAYYVVKEKLSGAVMLTASHNPPKYNGYKFIPHYGGPATTDITQKIEEEILLCKDKPSSLFNLSKQKLPNNFIYANPKKKYLTHLKKIINFNLIKKAKLKVGFNALYGTSRGYLDLILKEITVNPLLYNMHNDANFGGILPDPSFENLKPLAKEVIKNKLHLGLSCDQDADRFGIIGSSGEFYSPNQVGAMLSWYLIKRRSEKGCLVRTVATTHLIDAIGKKENCKVYETPVGFKYIGEIMRKEKTILGLEESGGLSIGRHLPEKDGILACLLVMEMVAEEKKSLKEIFNNLEKIYGKFINKRIDIHLTTEKKEKIMNRFKNNPPEKINNISVEKIVNLDGIKLILKNDDWVLIRASGTEPLIRVYLESKNKKELEKLKINIEKIIRNTKEN